MATKKQAKSAKVWDAGERTGLSPIQDSLEYLISVPLNPKKAAGGEIFDLYYFVHTASNPSTQKAVLFCAGGPGQIVRTLDRSKTYVDFLSKNGYNVVFFHLRGTGFSQIPPGTEYDKFLTVEFAIEDMEAIRAHFLGKDKGGKPVSWEAVIGWSFGTIVAQRYAHKYPSLVNRLVLISPLSRHTLKASRNDPDHAFEQYYDAMLAIYRNTLREIFESKKEALQNEFGDLTEAERTRIIGELFGTPEDHGAGGILRQTEEAFGGIQFVADAYAEIEDSDFQKFGLKKYSKIFYQSISDLRLYGSNAVDDTGSSDETERRIGKALRDEVLGQTALPRVAKGEGGRITQEYQRAYYAFGIHEGINWRFLIERRKGGNVRKAVRAIGGRAQLDDYENKKPNKWLEKIGIDTTMRIEAWDPADFRHPVPTLILNGEADPITAGGQAKRYFDAALDGPRTLITFLGVGHNISLGGTDPGQTFKFEVTPPLLSGAIRIAPPAIPSKAVREARGVATGWNLAANLWLKLIEPQKLSKAIRILGCGILQDGKSEEDKGGRANIVALIENKSDGDIMIEGRDWTLRSKSLSGTIDFGSPQPIKKGGIQLVYGKLVDGRKNTETEFHVLPGNLAPELKFLGFRLMPPSSVELWIQNQGDKGDKELENWTISNRDSKFRFKVNPPELAKNEIKPVIVGIDGLFIDANETLIVEPPEKLQGKLVACLGPQEDESRGLSFRIWNQDTSEKHPVDQGEWRLKSSIFSATVKFNPVTVAPGTVEPVAGNVTGLNWAKCLDLKPPAELEPGLELVCYNILEGNVLSMLIKNTSDRAIQGAAQDWLYVLPDGDSNMTDLNQALNAMIFSFLVLDPEQFHQEKDNVILTRIAAKFKVQLGSLLNHAPGKTDKKGLSTSRLK